MATGTSPSDRAASPPPLRVLSRPSHSPFPPAAGTGVSAYTAQRTLSDGDDTTAVPPQLSALAAPQRRVLLLNVVLADLAGITRHKSVPVASLAFVEAAQRGVSWTSAQWLMPIHADKPVVLPNDDSNEPLAGTHREVQVRPDPSSLRVFRGWSDLNAGHNAVVFGEAFFKGPQGARRFPLCARGFLRVMAERLLEDTGLELKAAFESEFYVTNDGERLDDTPYASSVAMIGAGGSLMGDVVVLLQNAGLSVELVHAESGRGQYELSTRYCAPTIAADNVHMVRAAVHTACARRGYRASFAPKPFADDAASGMHLHFSLWKKETNVTGRRHEDDKDKEDKKDDDKDEKKERKGKRERKKDERERSMRLSARGGMFIAGILAHLDALCAVTIPLRNGYARAAPGAASWVGVSKVWGYECKDAAVRVCLDHDGGISHIEYKAIDGCANPYLAIGCIIAAGLDGIKSKMSLPPPYTAGGDPQDAASPPPRIPIAPAAALEHLEADAVLREAMGGELLRTFVAVKRCEDAHLQALTAAQEAALLATRL